MILEVISYEPFCFLKVAWKITKVQIMSFVSTMLVVTSCLKKVKFTTKKSV